MVRLDPHSYADDAQPQAQHLSWQATLNWATRMLEARATLTFGSPSSGLLDLDTRDLDIVSAATDTGQLLDFSVAPGEPILGSRLRLDLPPNTRALTITYRTSPSASGLQWLDPAQTAGGQHPFLYSHGQPIHARSMVPLQDTPRTRLRYDAALTVPASAVVVMGAEALGREEGDGTWTYRFRMPQPISPYLFAFAVGDLVSQEIGPRSRVWAEPAIIQAAAWEFEPTDAMLRAGEALFGPYDWDRYDLLVLPPAFPYGGMENPRLTFATPTVLAGDRSLVALVAHELAHSWTGNLISNANAEHFWLNEGFTTYAERRIVEAVSGAEAALLDWAIGRRDLDAAIRQLHAEGRPDLARLRTTLQGIDPDDAYSTVPYERGALFLRALEESVGRESFDRFIRAYIARFRFKAITTEEFIAFVGQQLPGALEAVNALGWLYANEVPATAPRLHSNHLATITALGQDVEAPSDTMGESWKALEWQLYLESLPQSISLGLAEELDRRFHLSARTNYEVLVSWLTVALRAAYPPAVPRALAVLESVGRNKYLKPLYRALAERPDTYALACETFDRVKHRYHPQSVHAVSAILAQVARSAP